jgi:glutathione S-transferase
MWQLHQFPLCPFSRKVRLLLGEKGMPYALVREHPWERRDEFRLMNPAGRTPVLTHAERGLTLVDSRAICEYLDETMERPSLLGGTSEYRAEIRRLVAWFDENFYAAVTGPLLAERMLKRIQRQSPDGQVLRGAMRNAKDCLDYVDWLIDHRSWLAGSTMSVADLAGAAQISVADYLGGIDWTGHEQTRAWYAMMKSRPAFRPLLAERMEGITPPTYYEQVDF